MLTSVGSILALAGSVMLTPLFLLPFYPRESGLSLAFLAPALFMLLVGLILKKAFGKSSTSDLTISEGGVIVLLSWVSVTVVSAVPFQIVSGLSFSQAVFESVSGWTTTGLSLGGCKLGGAHDTPLAKHHAVLRRCGTRHSDSLVRCREHGHRDNERRRPRGPA